MPRGVRTGADVRAMSEATRAPGNDPRINLSFATVDELGYDSEHGIFADVTLLPDGQKETVIVGSDYAGNLFGDWDPIEVGDQVLVGLPRGAANQGPVLLKKIWSSKAKPPSQVQDSGDSTEPTKDRVLVVKPGQKYKIFVSQGGEADIVNDTASISVKGAEVDVFAGVVNIGDQSARPVAHSLEVVNALSGLVVLLGVMNGSSPPPVTPWEVAVAAAANTLATTLLTPAILATIPTTKGNIT